MTEDDKRPEDDDGALPEPPGGGDATIFTGIGPLDPPSGATGGTQQDPLASSDPLAPDPLAPDLLASPPHEPDPFASDPLASDPLAPDPLAVDPLAPDPLAPDPLMGGPADDPLAGPASDPLFDAPAPTGGELPADFGDDLLSDPAPAAPPAPGPAAAASFSDSNNSTFAPGSVLSHTYRIESFLARGGMGEVYKAQHNELGTWHAIKIILPELADNPKIIDLFRREAGVLRNVRHDAVVAYDGVFRDENGRVYLVMEFVDGTSLSDILKERKLSVAEVQALRKRIASGLGAAHETGVVHRDMSPDNIIIASGRVEDAKIIDFGIAKIADPNQATIIGDDFAGKYSYVSPEQLGMYGGVVDARSDIYSVGLILVAAAIGRSLDMGNSPMSVLEARKGVPDLSEVPVELVPELSAMLQPDPADRPQTMRAVMDLGGGGKDPLFDGFDDDEEEAPARPVAPSRKKPATAKGKKAGSSKSVGFALVLGLLVLAGAGAGGYFMFLAPSGNGGQDPGQNQTVETPKDGTTDGGSGQTAGETPPKPVQQPIQQPIQQPVQQPIQQPVNTPQTSGTTTTATNNTATSGNTATSSTTTSGTTTSGTTTSGTTTSGNTASGNTTTGNTGTGTTQGSSDSGGTISNQLQQQMNELGVQQADGQTAALPPATQVVDEATLKRGVNGILGEVRCGAVGARFIDAKGALSVAGHLPTDTEMQILRARLLGIEGVTSVEDVSLVSLPPPQCNVVDALPTSGLELARDQAAAAPPMGRPSQAGTLNFRAGQFLRLQLESPAYTSYYYVDYYDGANNVVHLLPSPVAQLNKLAPKQPFHIGGTDRYTIGPPYGLDLVVAVGSSVPLFAEPRPEVEKADVYLADLMRALKSAQGRAADFQGEYSYVFVRTRP